MKTVLLWLLLAPMALADSQAQETDALTVVTWNVRNLSGCKHASERVTAALELSRERGADVILLQEQFVPLRKRHCQPDGSACAAKPLVQRWAEDNGYAHCGADQYRTSKRDGLWILLKTEAGGEEASALQCQSQPFEKGPNTPRARYYDTLAKKGWLSASMGDLLIINTHMQASYPRLDPKERTAEVRGVQLDQLLEGVPAGRRVMIGGDFNVPEFMAAGGPPQTTAEYLRTVDAMNGRGLEDVSTMTPFTPTHEGDNTRLDYLFATSHWVQVAAEPMMTTVRKAQPVSDHHGVLVELASTEAQGLR